MLMRMLQESDWPYNVRQLDSVIQRLIDADGSAVLTEDACPSDLDFLRPSGDYRELTDAVIRETMMTARGKSDAARKLGVNRSTIYRRLARQKPPADHAASRSTWLEHFTAILHASSILLRRSAFRANSGSTGRDRAAQPADERVALPCRAAK